MTSRTRASRAGAPSSARTPSSSTGAVGGDGMAPPRGGGRPASQPPPPPPGARPRPAPASPAAATATATRCRRRLQDYHAPHHHPTHHRTNPAPRTSASRTTVPLTRVNQVYSKCNL